MAPQKAQTPEQVEGTVEELDLDVEVPEPIAAEIIEPESDEYVDPGRDLSPTEAKSALEAMLSSQPQDAPIESYTVARLGFDVTLRGLSEREIDQVGRRSERPPTKSERARGIIAGQRDPARFNLLLVSEALIDPDLTNRELLSRDGPNPADVVRKWFLPGEIIQLADTVMDLSGYSEEAITRAKKS